MEWIGPLFFINYKNQNIIERCLWIFLKYSVLFFECSKIWNYQNPGKVLYWNVYILSMILLNEKKNPIILSISIWIFRISLFYRKLPNIIDVCSNINTCSEKSNRKIENSNSRSDDIFRTKKKCSGKKLNPRIVGLFLEI